ncbi:FecR family protein [Williamwhitmania taraxaci]|uniref:FecR family protein n=1 Tax=Williamwhitmania taraxaci TaxID=1640674 RepID=A0A1G6JQT2_9BACT|nr:FecR domain-containing protein [Williamwhitmania taraxaci]SDC21021.1 FecR family protein [Williamwhitmania taraxaci]
MKLQQDNNKQVETIARFLAGEMGEAERASFLENADRLPSNRILIDKMKRDWDLIERYTKNNKVDTGKAWDKLHDRFQEEKLIPASKNVFLLQRRVMPVWQWAAVFVGIIGLGLTTYYVANQKPSTSFITLTTTSDPSALIQTLKDGSVVYLAHNTSFSYPEQFSRDERKVELTGEAYFDIARNPDKPFVIETSSATVEVLGTAFNVKSNKNSSFELIVERGQVRVTPKSGSMESFIINAGEKLTSTANHFYKEKNTDNSYLAWKTKRMRFKDETLENIVKVINSNYHSSIMIESDAVAARRLTVTFNDSSIETMTEVICVTLNLKSDSASGSTILREANDKRGN